MIGFSFVIGENLFPQISHKDVETYLLKSRSDDNEKMSCYRQFIRGFNFYKENYIHDIMINMIDDDSKRCYIRSQCFPLIFSLHFRRNCTSSVFFKVRKSSSVALESMSINFIFFRT
jgi:hypothetical protein